MIFYIHLSSISILEWLSTVVYGLIQLLLLFQRQTTVERDLFGHPRRKSDNWIPWTNDGGIHTSRPGSFWWMHRRRRRCFRCGQSQIGCSSHKDQDRLCFNQCWIVEERTVDRERKVIPPSDGELMDGRRGKWHKQLDRSSVRKKNPISPKTSTYMVVRTYAHDGIHDLGDRRGAVRHEVCLDPRLQHLSYVEYILEEKRQKSQSKLWSHKFPDNGGVPVCTVHY